jgi:prepilin signal peptidase PulO-like enzyme (type II secretory pathway)
MSQFFQQSVSAIGIILAISLVIAASTDLYQRKIFNWNTYPIIIWSILLGLTTTGIRYFDLAPTWISSIGLTECLAGILGCGGVTLVAYVMSGGGGGDVKLAMMIGGLIGLEYGLWAVAGGYILAAIGSILTACLDGTACSLAGGMLRKITTWVAPRLTLWLGSISDHQQQLLRRQTPLAGYFAASTMIVLW